MATTEKEKSSRTISFIDYENDNDKTQKSKNATNQGHRF